MAEKSPSLAYTKVGENQRKKEGEGEEKSTSQKDRDPLRWVVYRLSHVARSIAGEDHVIAQRRAAIIKFYAALASQFPVDRVARPFLTVMLGPLLRTSEGGGGGGGEREGGDATSSLRTLASEVETLLQRRVGTEEFVSARGTVVKGIAEGRRRRAQKEKQLAVTAPARFAARKTRRNASKLQARKRKRQRMRE